MPSPETPSSTDRTKLHAKATGERMPVVVRIALVAALAGCALVDLAVRTNPAADQYPAELAGTPAVSTSTDTDEGGAAMAYLSLLAPEYRETGPSRAPASMNDHRVIHIDEVRQASAATEYYFPAQFSNQARSNDGNVMTYEHD